MSYLDDLAKNVTDYFGNSATLNDLSALPTLPQVPKLLGDTLEDSLKYNPFTAPATYLQNQVIKPAVATAADYYSQEPGASVSTLGGLLPAITSGYSTPNPVVNPAYKPPPIYSQAADIVSRPEDVKAAEDAGNYLEVAGRSAARAVGGLLGEVGTDPTFLALGTPSAQAIPDLGKAAAAAFAPSMVTQAAQAAAGTLDTSKSLGERIESGVGGLASGYLGYKALGHALGSTPGLVPLVDTPPITEYQPLDFSTSPTGSVRGSGEVGSKIPLSLIGEEQALQTAEKLATSGVDKIVSNPTQTRQMQTAEPLSQATNLPITPEVNPNANLATRQMGGLEGQPNSPELQEKIKQADQEAPNKPLDVSGSSGGGGGEGTAGTGGISGEGLNEFDARVVNGLQEHLEELRGDPEKKIVVETSGQPVAVVKAHLAGEDGELDPEVFHQEVKKGTDGTSTTPGSLYRLYYGEEGELRGEEVEDTSNGGGVYLQRHGVTELNSPSEVEVAAKSLQGNPSATQPFLPANSPEATLPPASAAPLDFSPPAGGTTPPPPASSSTQLPPRVPGPPGAISPLAEDIAQNLGKVSPDLAAQLPRNIKQPWSELDPKVQQLLSSPTIDQDLANIRSTRPLDAAEQQAALFRYRQTQEAYDAATAKAKAPNATPEDIQDLLVKSADFAAASDLASKAGTDAGRILAARARFAAYKVTNADTTSTVADKIFSQLKDISAGDKQAILKALTVNPEDVPALIRGALNPTWQGQFAEWRRNLLFSAPSTPIAKALGDNIEGVLKLTDTAGAPLVDKLLSILPWDKGGPQERFFGEAGAEAAAAMKAYGPAVAQMVEDIKTRVSNAVQNKESQLDYNDKFANQLGQIPGRTGKVVRIPQGVLGDITKAFADTIGRAAETDKQLYRKAALELGDQATTKDIYLRMDDMRQEMITSPEKYVDIIKAVEGSIAERGFQTDLGKQGGVGKIIKGVNNLVTDNPLLALVLPTVKTPANLILEGWRRSPFGILNAASAYIEYLKGNISRGQAADTIIKPVLGTMLTGGLYALAKSGMLTGTGVGKSPKELAQLRDNGWQPVSLHFGNTYIPVSRLEPLTSIIGMAADAADIATNSKNSGDLLGKVAQSFTNNVTNHLFLESLKEFTDFFSNPSKAGSYLKNTLSSLVVPSIVSHAAAAIDPTVRDTTAASPGLQGVGEGLLNTIKSHIPGVSTTLPAKVDISGDEIQRPGVFDNPVANLAGSLARFGSPSVPSTDANANPVSQELLRIGYLPGVPSRNFKLANGQNVTLDDDQLSTLQRASQTASQQFSQAMAQPGYQALPDTIAEAKPGQQSKESIARGIFQQAKDQARQKVYAQLGAQRRIANRGGSSTSKPVHQKVGGKPVHTGHTAAQVAHAPRTHVASNKSHKHTPKQIA